MAVVFQRVLQDRAGSLEPNKQSEEIVMKKIVSIMLVSMMIMALAACGKDGGSGQGNDGAGASDSQAGGDTGTEASGSQAGGEIDPAGKHHVEITVKDYGTISVELDGDAAPITVANFLKLAGAGFFDGLNFHRVVPGFVIKGGDPQGSGTGGSDENIKGEFSANGVENNLSHTRGAISMARSQMPDSASSQFFIVHEDSTFLDGQYACFGYVTEGIEVVDAICEALPAQDDIGNVAKENQPVIESIKVID